MEKMEPEEEIPEMAGVMLCEPTELYNMLNQATRISRLAEQNYLYLLDARTKREYNESHLVTAIRVKQNLLGKYLVPESINLQCVKHCVVYDGKTDSVEAAFDMDYDVYDVDKDLKEYGEPDIMELTRKGSPKLNAKEGSAARCARVMQRHTCFPVMVLRGGYELFTRSYHFLRTQKIFWMPRELEDFKPYPVEILPAKLYMGNYKQACDKQIQKDLKIRAQLNVSEEVGTFFLEDPDRLLHIPIPDSPEADLSSFFIQICHFIGWGYCSVLSMGLPLKTVQKLQLSQNTAARMLVGSSHFKTAIQLASQLGAQYRLRGTNAPDQHLHQEAVLVFSTLGISRSSTAVMAYLMHSCRLHLKSAWNYVQKCKDNMRPNRGFVNQLSEWEQRLYIARLTDTSEPNY